MRALIHVSAWERVSLWRRLLCAFARVAVLLTLFAVLINFLGPPIGIFFLASLEGRKAPWVNVVPRPLADYSVFDAPGTRLSYFGYEFEVPWNTNYKQKAFGKGGFVQLEFESGQNLLLIVPANQSGVLTEIVQARSLNMHILQPVFGDLMRQSAYDQYSALLNTTPGGIRAFGRRTEAIRGMALLTIKGIAVAQGLETGVYSFELPGKRGFQIADPRQSRNVSLEVFGMGDHHLEIFLTAPKDGAGLTQPEINRILTSLHATSPESPAGLHAAPLK